MDVVVLWEYNIWPDGVTVCKRQLVEDECDKLRIGRNDAYEVRPTSSTGMRLTDEDDSVKVI